MFRKMLEIRFFEENVYYLFLQGNIAGTVHLYAGEEAVAVGVCASLERDDFVVSTHRPHGHYIAKGGRVDKLMAELFAKKTGCNKAKGGSMHVCDMDIGMLPAIGIVGANVPIAAGVGLSAQMRKTRQVVACFFGDGAVNQGMWHEGINMAAIWRLPVIFICENNLYAASTNISKTILLENIADKAKAYGIPGFVVDGNDVLATYSATQEAVMRARDGMGPTLIECKTYRRGGHSRSDPATYRPKSEVDEWLKKDPIVSFRKKLIEGEVLIESQAKSIEQNALELIEKAVSFAEKSPSPEPDDALVDIYA